MKKFPSIAVLGGGILGRFLALELFERGENVTLIEKGPANGKSSCGYVGLGMISPWSEIPHIPQNDSVTLEAAFVSLKLWPELLKKIDCEQPYLQRGALLLSRRGEENGLIHLQRQMKSLDIPLAGESLTGAQLLHCEPELNANFPTGLFLSQEGCVDTRTVFVSLTKHFEKIGLSCVYECNDFSCENYDFIFDTRGLGAKNASLGLRGVRGETIRVQAPQVNLSRLIRVVDSKFPLYIVPRGEGIYTIGATCLESESHASISVRSLLEMFSMARFVHEGFMEATVLETAVQWRPAYGDNKPKMIQEKKSISINGLYRHGILCAPAFARWAVDIFHGNCPLAAKESYYEN